MNTEFVNEISRLFPKLNITDFRLFGSGWTSQVFLVNKKIIFKMPVNSDFAHCIEREACVLESLKGNTSIAIPELLYKGITESGLPIIGETLISGVPLSSAEMGHLDNLKQDYIFSQIGVFLREIHSIQVENQFLYRFDGLSNLDFGKKCLKDEIQLMFSKVELKAIKQLFDFFEYWNNPNEKLVFSHGDLHKENLLYNPDTGKLTGVIDFGSACYADSLYDLRYFYNFGIDKIAKAMNQILTDKELLFVMFFQLCNELDFLNGYIKRGINHTQQLQNIKELIKHVAEIIKK